MDLSNSYHCLAAFLFRLHWWDHDREVGGLLALKSTAAGARTAASIFIAVRHLGSERISLPVMREEARNLKLSAPSCSLD